MNVHPSEHQVGRIKYCKSCNRAHLFPRYQAKPHELPPAIPLVRLLNVFIASTALWMVVIALGLSVIR